MNYIDPRERRRLIEEAPETDKITHKALETWFFDRMMEYSDLRDAYDKAHGLETVKQGYWIDDAYSDHTDRELQAIIATDEKQDPPRNMTHPDWSVEPLHRYHDCSAGSDYCITCIEEVMERIKELRRQRADAKGIPEGSLAEEVLEDDIYISTHSGENDSHMYCAVCGHILECTLTEYGLSEEISHFDREESADPVKDGELAPWAIGMLYNFEQMAEAARSLDVLQVEDMLKVKENLEREDSQKVIAAIRERVPEKENV